MLDILVHQADAARRHVETDRPRFVGSVNSVTRVATLAVQARAAGGRCTIISSDKDLMQLVGGGVEMLDAMKNKRIDREGVFEKFGVYPERVVDVQALAGDSVDNVPGAPGIGIKTAALLINEYGLVVPE